MPNSQYDRLNLCDAVLHTLAIMLGYCQVLVESVQHGVLRWTYSASMGEIGASGHTAGAQCLLPSFKCLTTNTAIVGRRRVTMANAKQVADVSMSPQEPLSVLGGLESSHLPLLLPGVQALVLAMHDARQEVALGPPRSSCAYRSRSPAGHSTAP